MSKNVNVESATYDGQGMGQPMDYRLACTGETIEDSAGIDTFIASNDLVRRRVEVQVLFKDWDDASTMVTGKWGNNGSLIIITRVQGAATSKTFTITNCRCRDVLVNASHNEIGVHVAIFVGRTTDGITNPVT